MMHPPTLITARLTLRPHRRDDFPECCALWADPVVTRFIGGKPSTPEDVWSRLLRYAGLWSLLGYGYFAIFETKTLSFVGEAGLADFHRDLSPFLGETPEAGWALLPSFHGRGYASEALGAILDWIEVPRTACLIAPDNTASLRLATTLGYREYARTTYRAAPTILLARER